jgi:outer membrane receptor protein involved in Fe transport
MTMSLSAAPRVAVGLVLTACAGASVAQQSPSQVASNDTAPVTGIEEVIVTALKRDTSLQETPISISAVTGATLTNSGVQDLSRLTQSVPGLVFEDNGPTNTRITIRGIRSVGEPTVGLYYDETPVSGAVGAGNDSGGETPLAKLFDVQRVEVLRGPQGTLYGSGSMGGTLRVIFNKPDANKFAASVDADAMAVDGGSGGYDAQGMVNVPIVTDKLAARAVVYSEGLGGYVDNNFLHEHNVNTYHNDGGRFLLRYTPFEALTLDASYFYQYLDGQSPTWYNSQGPYVSLAHLQLPLSDRMQIYNFTARWDFHWFVATAVVADTERTVKSAGDVSPFISNDANNPAACAAFRGGGKPCTANTQAAFNNYVFSKVPSALFPIQTIYNPTGEVRLSSPGKGFLDWTVGGFYSDRTTHANNSEVLADPTTGVLLPQPQNDVYTRLISDHLKQVAGFGEGTAHLTDALALTFGARYFDYTRDVGGATLVGLDLVGAAVTPYRQVSSGEHGWVTKTNLSYQFNSDLMVYATASQGFRPGGVNQVLGLPTALAPYSSDSLWNYELGTKTSWFQKRLIFNLDGYLINWSDMQVSGRTPNGAFSFITNAGAARVKGVEFDLSALPLENLQISADASISRAALTENQVNPNVLGPGVKGNEIPYVPRFTGGISAQYTLPITSSLAGMARVDESYVGSSFSEFNNSNHFDTKLPAYSMTNVRLGVEGTQKDWGIYLYANNVFDKNAIVYSAASAISLGQNLVDSQPPRTYGLNFRKSFTF